MSDLDHTFWDSKITEWPTATTRATTLYGDLMTEYSFLQDKIYQTLSGFESAGERGVSYQFCAIQPS